MSSEDKHVSMCNSSLLAFQGPLAHCLLEELVVMGVGNPVREDDIKSLLSVRPPPEFFSGSGGASKSELARHRRPHSRFPR